MVSLFLQGAGYVFLLFYGLEKFMKYWNTNKYKNKINTVEFYKHLYEAQDVNDYIKLLKLSGVFTSGNSSNGTKLIAKYILVKKFYILNEQIVNKFLFEISILNQLYEMIQIEKKSLLDITKRNILQSSLYYAQAYYESFKSSNNRVTDLSDGIEEIWLRLGDVLKDSLRKKTVFKWEEGVSLTQSEIENIFSIFSHLNIFSLVIDLWTYSDIEFKIYDNQIHIKEIGDFSIKRLYSLATYLDLKDFRAFWANNPNLDFDTKLEKSDVKQNLYKLLEKQVKEYFYTKNFEEEYDGIKLRQWMDAYWILYELCVESDERIVVISKNKLRELFIDKGLPEYLLKQLIFKTSSRDLYDNPLIEFEEVYVVLSSLVLHTDFSRTILSVISKKQQSKETGINQKGRNFELHINSLAKKQFSKQSAGIKRTIDGETFEIDGIFFKDGTLVIIEAKTQNQPTNIIEFYKNQVELNNYIEKFKRNSKYFTENEKKIMAKKLGIYSSDIKRVINMFVSNVSQYNSKQDEIYFIDEIDFSNFMNRRIPQIHVIEKGNIYSVDILPQLYSGEATVDQLLNLLQSDHKRELITRRIKYRNIQFNIIDKTISLSFRILEDINDTIL